MIKEFKTAVVISDHLKLAKLALDIWRGSFIWHSQLFSYLATYRYSVLLYWALATGFVAGSAISIVISSIIAS